METKKFDGANTAIAEEQEQYQTLHAHYDDTPDGIVTCCWKANWVERLQILITGHVWLQIMTFKQALQPILMLTDKPKLD